VWDLQSELRRAQGCLGSTDEVQVQTLESSVNDMVAAEPGSNSEELVAVGVGI
jgi:hypothetical protein